MSRKCVERERGAALITVLWLTAALALIGLAVASTVRGEVGRAENSMDAARAELLARGAIDRYLFLALNPMAQTPGRGTEYRPGLSRFYWQFPGGDVLVEVLGESGKLGLNNATGEQMLAAMMAAGYPPEASRQIAEAILDWRTLPPGGVSTLDSYYLSRSPTFRPHHASFQQVEELLMIRGITPHLYYGGRERVPGGPVVARAGLSELFSVQGSAGQVDINSAHPAVLASVGLLPGEIQTIVNSRTIVPYTPESVAGLTLTEGPATRVLRAGFDRAYTIKATARPRISTGDLSDFRWTSSALVVYETVNNNLQLPRIRSWSVASTTETPWPIPEARP